MFLSDNAGEAAGVQLAAQATFFETRLNRSINTSAERLEFYKLRQQVSDRHDKARDLAETTSLLFLSHSDVGVTFERVFCFRQESQLTKCTDFLVASARKAN